MCLKVQNDKKTNQSQACLTYFDHCRDLFRDKLSINQAIFDNIYLGTGKKKKKLIKSLPQADK